VLVSIAHSSLFFLEESVSGERKANQEATGHSSGLTYLLEGTLFEFFSNRANGIARALITSARPLLRRWDQRLDPASKRILHGPRLNLCNEGCLFAVFRTHDPRRSTAAIKRVAIYGQSKAVPAATRADAEPP
jgi:hypothetical protein